MFMYSSVKINKNFHPAFWTLTHRIEYHHFVQKFSSHSRREAKCSWYMENIIHIQFLVYVLCIFSASILIPNSHVQSFIFISFQWQCYVARFRGSIWQQSNFINKLDTPSIRRPCSWRLLCSNVQWKWKPNK